MKNIPKQSATLEDIINFYRNSDVYRRLSSSSQKDYDNHLSATLITEVEGKPLRAYRCKNLKVRHITQAYDQWLQVGTRTANYRRSVLSAAWKHAMRHDVFIHNPILWFRPSLKNQGEYIGVVNKCQSFLTQLTATFAGAALG